MFLFNWVITIVLFGLASWLIAGFRLKNGFVSAILGGLAYSVLSSVVLGSWPRSAPHQGDGLASQAGLNGAR